MEKHKKMIENNEAMTNERSEKVQCENKELKYKAELLAMDRDIVKQSLEETERAFQE